MSANREDIGVTLADAMPRVEVSINFLRCMGIREDKMTMTILR